jgi:hypothetical protein
MVSSKGQSTDGDERTANMTAEHRPNLRSVAAVHYAIRVNLGGRDVAISPFQLRSVMECAQISYPPVVINGGGVRTVSVVRLAAVACAFTLVACGSSAGPRALPRVSSQPSSASAVPSATPDPSASATPSPPMASPSRFREAYANAFEDFWMAYARADRDADPNSALLASTATGAALSWAKKQITDHRKLGVAHRGTAYFRSVGAEHVTARSVLIGQCMDWSQWPVVNRTTGAAFQQFAPYSQLVKGQMVFAEGAWKLATIQVRAVSC